MRTIFFDSYDHDIVKIVNDILNRDSSHKDLKKLLNPYLHPRGVKEMAAPRELRIAYATAHLLDMMEWGGPQERLEALKSMHEDVVNITYGNMRINTARVLIQITKDMLRFRGDKPRQLRLAHDFRLAASGKAGIVRKFLDRYHLLEMPEQWNQIAFDHHVHDSSTKGRKTPSHLIMDAWIKGIRSLTVIYYNRVNAAVASELLDAARIMGIDARVGIEFSARYRRDSVKFIWIPYDFKDKFELQGFLDKDNVKELMSEGQAAIDFQTSLVLKCLDAFNKKKLNAINLAYGFEMGTVSRTDFISFVGTGQPSVLHLSEFIYQEMEQRANAQANRLMSYFRDSGDEEYKRKAEEIRKSFRRHSPRVIMKDYLDDCVESKPGSPDTCEPETLAPDLKYTPLELLHILKNISPASDIILNLTDLTVEDVLEIIYECHGLVTHLELYNLKDSLDNKARHNKEIDQLRKKINEGSIVELKNFITQLEEKQKKSWRTDREDRQKKIRIILRNIEKLQFYYSSTPLKVSIGSDSAGRIDQLFGMGLVIKETLPPRPAKTIDKSSSSVYETIPIKFSLRLTKKYIPRKMSAGWRWLLEKIAHGDQLRILFYHKQSTGWEIEHNDSRLENNGHIATMGGRRQLNENVGKSQSDKDHEAENTKLPLMYINTKFKNWMKVFIGFIPAFLTFLLTKDWWLLAYFGAFIWFGITGMRNIVQSVVGGGGFRNFSMLKWSDFVSWERVADSLLFTGFSVPLLDYLAKTMLLDRQMGITTSTNPIALYAIMALVNGIYISSHNIIRGLPRQAAIGNFFRSILSIPIAILFSAFIGFVLSILGVNDVQAILQMWAAVISKSASDFVAGFIEGAADRTYNIQARFVDYRNKISQLLDTFEQLELASPDGSALEILKGNQKLSAVEQEAQADVPPFSELEKILMIDSLDLLYFWMYQPRAQSAFKRVMRELTPDEMNIVVETQQLLTRNKEISQIFIDGLIGNNFSDALSLYLGKHQAYLNRISYLKDKGRLTGKNAE